MNGKRKDGTREERVVTNVGEIMTEMFAIDDTNSYIRCLFSYLKMYRLPLGI